MCVCVRVWMRWCCRFLAVLYLCRCVSCLCLSQASHRALWALLVFLSDFHLCIIWHSKPFSDTGISPVLHFTGTVCVRVCVCECVREREREWERETLGFHCKLLYCKTELPNCIIATPVITHTSFCWLIRHPEDMAETVVVMAFALMQWWMLVWVYDQRRRWGVRARARGGFRKRKIESLKTLTITVMISCLCLCGCIYSSPRSLLSVATVEKKRKEKKRKENVQYFQVLLCPRACSVFFRCLLNRLKSVWLSDFTQLITVLYLLELRWKIDFIVLLHNPDCLRLCSTEITLVKFIMV